MALKIEDIKVEEESTGVYKFITDDVEVAVRPEYIDSQARLAGDVYFWAYHVKIENRSNDTIQLISRYWKIIDGKGGLQEVNGEGAIGEKPILIPNADFSYTSGVHLRYHSGIMSGYYIMKKSNGELFKVKIPAFSLDVPNLKDTVN